MSDIPIGMLQNDELFNALCALAISGGADIRTLFMVAQVAGIEAAFMHRLKQYGLANFEPVPLSINHNAGRHHADFDRHPFAMLDD